ncbi:energy transducer TonB [Kordiimonas marina]|uniref:energy transducer TonB n=1 Tax=Kordiimonas marina TaxID=2872312 RepID=UPI001FF47C77|nr:energy transducer TonB [Kordiimonas marina]MCJ9429504.1 energy transducer TonB [Kordiimonas marina]
MWRVSSCTNPNLSFEAKKSTEPGSVTAVFDITPNGRVTNIRIQHPEASHGMANFVKAALRRWRYFAYLADGKEAGRTDVTLTFTYGMDGKESCTYTRVPSLTSTAAPGKH